MVRACPAVHCAHLAFRAYFEFCEVAVVVGLCDKRRAVAIDQTQILRQKGGRSGAACRCGVSVRRQRVPGRRGRVPGRRGRVPFLPHQQLAVERLRTRGPGVGDEVVEEQRDDAVALVPEFRLHRFPVLLHQVGAHGCLVPFHNLLASKDQHASALAAPLQLRGQSTGMQRPQQRTWFRSMARMVLRDVRSLPGRKPQDRG